MQCHLKAYAAEKHRMHAVIYIGWCDVFPRHAPKDDIVSMTL